MELAVVSGLKVLHTMLEDESDGDLRSALPNSRRYQEVDSSAGRPPTSPGVGGVG